VHQDPAGILHGRVQPGNLRETAAAVVAARQVADRPGSRQQHETGGGRRHQWTPSAARPARHRHAGQVTRLVGHAHHVLELAQLAYAPRQFRILPDPLDDPGPFTGIQLVVDKGVEPLVGDVFLVAHFTLLSLGRRLPCSQPSALRCVLSLPRARDRRLMTVPIGMSRIRATWS
jgi:hypothetical protein